MILIYIPCKVFRRHSFGITDQFIDRSWNALQSACDICLEQRSSCVCDVVKRHHQVACGNTDSIMGVM